MFRWTRYQEDEMTIDWTSFTPVTALMGGGLAVNALFFHLLKRPSPYLVESFSLPTLTRLDKPLLICAALFGIG